MPFKFGVDSSGNYGYIKDGADTVTPFRTGTATTAQVLSGYTFANAKYPDLTGAMPNNGAVSSTLNCGASYTIPKGYHNGSGKVTANSLASQTSATATAANIGKGKTAWVNGVKLTGTMASVECKTGSGTYGSGGYSTNTHTINFPSAFSKTPTVYAFRTGYTPVDSNRGACNPNLTGISSVSKKSFVLTISNDSRDASNVNVRWCAVV